MFGLLLEALDFIALMKQSEMMVNVSIIFVMCAFVLP